MSYITGRIEYSRVHSRPNLTLCLEWFMKPNLDLMMITRASRISCVKLLITTIDERKLSVLRSEVQTSLELINEK